MDREKAEPPVLNRRALLEVMAASLALAGTTGRSAAADERALPYVNAPEFVIPGKPKWYATSVGFAGYLQPVLGKTEVGRPIKLEGNPGHPATHGATDPFMQAALLGLYDPARSQAPSLLGQPSTWDAFDTALAARAAEADRVQGEGLRLLTGAVTSPTLLRQIGRLTDRWPKARWHVSEPVNDDGRLEAARRVFGRRLQVHTKLDVAEVVVSLDDDLVGPGPRQASHGRAWSERRLARQRGSGDARLFAAEPTPSATGAMADERLIVASSRMGRLVAAIAHEMGIAGSQPTDLTGREGKWLAAVATALRAHQGKALLSVGSHYPPELHVLALLVNERLGAFGTTLAFTAPIAESPSDQVGGVASLVDEMSEGRVSTLLMLDTNPAYATPGGLGFRKALERVPFRLHAGLYVDDTATLCHWHAPLQHDLESWTDGRAVDGTAAIVQPLVRPFYSVRSMHVVLDRLLGGSESDHELVQTTWRDVWRDSFDARWRDALIKGVVADGGLPPVDATVVDRTVPSLATGTASDLVVDVRADPTVWDGRFARNAWLQETPKPFTKVTWGNVILLSPALATARGIQRGDELKIEAGGRSLVGAAWIMPGQERQTLTVSLGYGQTIDGVSDRDLGYDAFSFVDVTSPWRVADVALSLTGKRQVIASTQLSQDMTGFDFVRTVGAADAAVARRDEKASFYPQRTWDSPSWGMSIDLDLCIGCNACLVACMAENNVPVVGKELVAEGREMHWLRIDHYYDGDIAEPKLHFQPVPCMHCEQAPCEMGCPVNATVHSSDGLNVQVYNRCIGTRTCSAYCPYKVRRFNWYEYTGNDPAPMKAMRNPDVTVRSRGVMEKCTYCVQRISLARIAAKVDGRPIGDGEVVTACQQACPTQAIGFGDVADPKTAVSRSKASPRNYSLLEEANTRPRTTYLARIAKEADE